jgi:hypothetical protein
MTQFRFLSIVLVAAGMALAQTAKAEDQKPAAPPESKSLDLSAIDKTADPCTNFYQYACGNWVKSNPIPSDQVIWARSFSLLRVTESKGLVHVVTHAKDIDLSQIYGDSYVENRDGRISVEPAGAYNVEAKNSKGDVEITLPPNASASVDGHTHNGDIVTEYGLTVSGDEDKTVTGRIGSGQSKIELSSSNGDLRIKKGPAFPSAPSVANAPTAPEAPAPPNAHHLKPSKPEAPQLITQ